MNFYENCWGIGQEIIELGKSEGVFNQEIDTLTNAKMMRAIIDGSLIQWLTCNEEGLHQFYKDSCTNSILKLLQ